MTTLVLGAGGILGQHLYLQRPEGAIFVRRTAAEYCQGVDLSERRQLDSLLEAEKPSVVINLAGQNRVDQVDYGVFDDPVYRVNVGLPAWLTKWCNFHRTHLIQVSSQGVFSGNHPPYGPKDIPHPVTAYGQQKALAERWVTAGESWTLVRVTFVLGIRPFPSMGRENPLEQMLRVGAQKQVNDRFFSVSFAPDVATELWNLADDPSPRQIIHLGTPERTCRYDIARLANPGAEIEPVSDDIFSGPRRPTDTTWATGCWYRDDLATGIDRIRNSLNIR